MIVTYIQELLATNNRVIVPNYGAFLVRATSKSKDASNLAEKLKDVYFSPFLKFNDELLEKHIIKKENVTKEQAAEKITAFINEVKKELEKEKPYKIEGFGEFISDKQGKVQFLTLAKDTVEKAPSAKKEEKKETEKPAKESKTAITKKTTAAKKEEKSKVEEKPKEEQKEESKLKEFKPETKATPAVEATKSIYSGKPQKKSINKSLVWSIALGLPIAAIFVWGLLNFSTVKKVFTKDKAKTEKAVKKETATNKDIAKAKEETTKKETEVKEETTAKPEVQKPAPVEKNYYIIAGSFKNENYAISYMNKLKAEGYNAEILAKRNGMHAVSFNSFADKKKALAEYKYLVNEKGLQAWILYN